MKRQSNRKKTVKSKKVVIETKSLTKYYRGKKQEFRALNNVSFAVYKGEFIALMGRSGSGKSTLMNIIGCLDRASSGDVFIEGDNVSFLNDARLAEVRGQRIGFIFQTFNLFPSLTALENVQFVVDVVGRQNGSEKLATSALASVGLGSRMHHFPHQLSGGEQQRVAIARALAKDAPVILADEPTGELDFRTGVQILELLKRQAEAEKSVVSVTHNREIARMADRVVELHDGQVASDGPPQGGPVSVDELMW